MHWIQHAGPEYTPDWPQVAHASHALDWLCDLYAAHEARTGMCTAHSMQGQSGAHAGSNIGLVCSPYPAHRLALCPLFSQQGWMSLIPLA